MSESNRKFLVELVRGLEEQQVFFFAWFIVVGFFVMLMYSYHRKVNRRNFREPGDSGPKVRVDPRQLKDSHLDKDIVVKKDRVGVKRSYPTGKR